MTDLIPLDTDLIANMRRGLLRLAKAVVIITSRHDGERLAMAATAVSELSNAPPSLLICVNQTASMYAPLSAGAPFCVNILAKGHSDLANLCSGKAKGEHRFSLGDWADSRSGPPILRDAQASFVCINDQTVNYGTHAIFMGRVIDVHTSGDVDPLIYVDHRFTEIVKAAPIPERRSHQTPIVVE